MINLGTVRPGSTLYIPFDTFAGSTGASITMTGLAVTDIEIYKNGSVTQRASDTGFTLLDTDGIDFDALTGIHGFSIDLSSNADAGFYAAGADYFVVVSAITVDSQTVSFVAARFTIGYEDAIINTTIATLASQTSFTLTSGPAEDDALNGCRVVIHDVASAVQLGTAVIQDYTGSTKTVTLVAGTSFTAAATDNISIFPPALLPTVAGRTLDVSAAGEAGMDWANIGSPTSAQNLSATNIDTDQAVASVSGAVGSVTGLTAATVHSDLDDIQARLPAALTANGNMKSSLVEILTTVLTETAGQIAAAFKQFFDVASPTGTMKAITSVVTVTNLTNAPTAGDLTAAMKASVNAEVVDTLNVDTYAEPTGAPAATTTLAGKIGRVYQTLRNAFTVTASAKTFKDDANSTLWSKALSDDGTTYTEAEGS